MDIRTTFQFLLPFLLLGCQSNDPLPVPQEWETFETNVFSFQGPADLKRQHVQGIDSYVGQFGNGEIELNFDYGSYSDPLDDNHKKNDGYLAKRTKVDLKKATVVTYKRSDPEDQFLFCAGIHFPDTGDGQTKLTLFGRAKTQEGQDQLSLLFLTLQFGTTEDEPEN